ncbi:sperm-specific protein PHI-2B/PHI-3-like [Branchiostoma floridae]|uniref:Sperm-specific protein PHI-2B/PHI-3-like n=2 Tax=Branchiostoma floridae TaxID=7739 RepID=A0A9J7LYI7_BRAFL|nr:sperm-specific protein PHI-2B/PHI-3-like [Branchiostoma floridae]
MSDEELDSGSGSESVEESSGPEAAVATAGAAGKAARPPANHPTTLDMVVEAIEALGDSKGASVQAIKQWIPARYPTVDPARLGSLVKKALAKGLETGRLVRPKKSEGLTGATGRFKVGKPPKPEKKPAKKKPAAKKAKPKKAVDFENGDASSESSPEENGVYDYPDEESEEGDSDPPPPPKKKAVAKAKKPATKAKKSPKEKAPAKKTKAAAETEEKAPAKKTKTAKPPKEPKENGTSKPKSKTKAAAKKEATKDAKKSPKKTAAKPRGRPKKVAADSD